MDTGSKRPATVIGDIISDKLGTANEAITGNPPLPKPTKIAAKMAKNQYNIPFSIQLFDVIFMAFGLVLIRYKIVGYL